MHTTRSLALASSLILGASIAIITACSGSNGSASGDSDGGASSSSSSSGGGTSSSSSSSSGDGGGSIDGPPHGPGATGSPCKADGDCQSGGCNYAGVCASAASCTAHNGGDTCGADGKTDCCTTIAVPKPNAALKLDKFNITAGRMRVFIDKTGGNVRGYIQAHRPTWFEPAWDAMIPIKMDDGTAMTGDDHLFPAGKGLDGVYQQLGPIHYGAAEAGGNEGCLTKEVGNARTYRLPDDVNQTLFADVQQYPQDVLDQKPQQCATFFMFAAFCAWDGGRLPTLDEIDYAWDTGDPTKHTYPWGNTPVPAGWDNAYPSDPTGQGFGKTSPANGDKTVANYRYNFWMPGTMACVNNDPAKCDYSLYIAPPGHFPKGDGPFGHSDLAGNVYDVAMPMDGTPGTDPTTRNVGLSKTGAFDSHAIPNQHPVAGFRGWKATNKYLAVGARCAR